ncbi:MAG: flagellar hook-basal body complex protein [Burkholderiales bacterium]|nr:flagellar hook-basal body complex protein [Burkholderiales bacterium]
MSFYTSLTGLNAATAMLGVTSNNIANVGTTGFKRSRADFGDIFATSPLQKASSTVGQGVALKQVSQEFGQGNISFSTNALDLAITGDGFFPLRSADGLQQVYTRNGSFMLNEQFNVVNSAGQRLMAATVDSTGSANINERVVLTIPQKTSGEAKQTSQVSLGLNFPADASVITDTFSRTNPASYNKSTAFTVYDNGGNGYLATIYYVKTQNANQNSPFNKWQTYVYVGEDQVSAALAQSTDINGDLQYVNQYGQIKSYKDVKDELTTAKTQLISLDELTDKRTSAPAGITGVASTVDLTGGTNTFAGLQKLPTPIDLSNLFTVNFDNSTAPVTVDLSYLKDSSTTLTGATLAAEATKFLARKFGDETTFNFSSPLAGVNPDKVFTLTDSRVQNGSPVKFEMTLSGFADESNVTVEELTKIMQTQVDNSVLGGHARTSVAISGSATSEVTFMGSQIVPSGNNESAAATAGNIVAAKEAIITKNPGLENVELGADGTSVVLTYNKFPRQTVTLSGTATASTSFMGVAVAGSAKGNTPAQTAALIVANKASVLEGTAAKDAHVTDITIDPADPTKLILTYGSLGTATDIAAAIGYANAATTPTIIGGVSAAFDVNGAHVTPPGQNSSSDSGGITMGAHATLSSGLGVSPMKVSYDYSSQSFKITDSTNAGANVITLAAGAKSDNAILGLTSIPVTLDTDGLSGLKMLPNNKNPLRSIIDQRYGMKVNYDAVTKSFSVSSGTTGDQSSIDITGVSSSGVSLMGLSKIDASIAKSSIATRGIASTPAVAVGKPPTVNVANNFAVNNINNKFIVTVDGIKGTVIVPPSTTYSLENFMKELQKGINSLASVDGDSPTTVNGVKVTYDYASNNFVFTSGTTGSDSFIKISGSGDWGLDQVEAGRGSTSTWIKPSQHKDVVGGALQPKYIDKNGVETTNGDGFTGLPAWSPIYLDKGELTFDTGGKLYSPVKGTQLETVYLAGGKGALTINVDYAASTQYTSPFAVLSQSQDGAPEGSLVGVTIGNDGLVNASFSNGSQKSLAKILLANFSSPVGLRQTGDSTFLSSAASGNAILGTAGSAGFGTLRAGATERANVDLTQELVDLITAQRNFQANAKAIETSTTMTSAIINMRAG